MNLRELNRWKESAIKDNSLICWFTIFDDYKKKRKYHQTQPLSCVVLKMEKPMSSPSNHVSAAARLKNQNQSENRQPSELNIRANEEVHQ